MVHTLTSFNGMVAYATTSGCLATQSSRFGEATFVSWGKRLTSPLRTQRHQYGPSFCFSRGQTSVRTRDTNICGMNECVIMRIDKYR